ncbi:MAG: type II CAAX endopeptidase family protein [Pseudolysinimonas sp.]|uniref:CPBP family intramembrane glutamic endopeptidase n=1 Tax=Pseudolysinimonas sp. TaxID=2680009 RepID=UPI003265BEC2
MTDLPPPPPPTSRAEQTTIVELPYHRLFRAQPTYRWWRPLVALVMAAVFFLGVQVVLAIVLVVVLFANGTISVGHIPTQTELLAELSPDLTNPWTLVFGLGAILLVLPLIPLALRIAGIRPSGYRVNILHSVTFRLRWRWLGVTAAISAVVWIVSLAVQVLVGVASGQPLLPFSTPIGPYLVGALIVVLLVPLQAATEEYLFRGVLQQVIGAWARWAPVGIVISATLFALSHSYDIWGQLQVGILGVSFAIAAIRTGGLESGIAYHSVHNIGTFLITGTGMFGPTNSAGAVGTPMDVIPPLITAAVWLTAIEFAARRMHPQRISRIAVTRLVPDPPTQPGMPATLGG